MKTALNAPLDALDESEQNFVASIREHGWFRTQILGDEHGPDFSFTTGFWVTANQPELIMFSLRREIAHKVFWSLFGDAKAGKSIAVGRRTNDVFGNSPAYAFPIARRFYRDYLGWSLWFYGGVDEFPCLQIIWPDRSGLFPWETGFDPAFADDQPDLTEHGWLAAIED
jgi:hypothetical protein